MRYLLLARRAAYTQITSLTQSLLSMRYLLLLVFLLPITAQAQNPQEEYIQLVERGRVSYQTQISRTVEARSEPSESASVTGALEAGGVVTVVDVSGRWLLVATPEAGRIGWIPDAVVEPTDAPLPEVVAPMVASRNAPAAPPPAPTEEEAVQQIARDVATIRTVVVVQFILTLLGIGAVAAISL